MAKLKQTSQSSLMPAHQKARQAQMQFEDAMAFHQRGELFEAELLYEAVLKQVPKHFDALHLLGVVALQKGELERAQALIAKALKIDARSAAAYNNYGNVLQELRQTDAALVSYNKAITLAPNYAEAYNNRGDLLQSRCQWDAALASFDQALALEPANVSAHFNRANVLRSRGRFSEALEAYGKVLALNPRYDEAYRHRGHTFAELKRFSEAIQNYDQALTLRPQVPYLLGTRLHLKMLMCDWKNFETEYAQIARQSHAQQPVCLPFPLLALTDDAAQLKRTAEYWIQDKHPAPSHVLSFKQRPRIEASKLRLGYFSADFYDHPVAQLSAGLFESHDRARFEIFAFSSGPDTQDSMRLRLEKAFDEFVDVKDMSDHDVVRLARERKLDIAIDLSGLTRGCRPGLFAARVAPLQINYLGYPGTNGANYFDYIVADQTLVPTESEAFYAEKIIRMPHSYQVNDRKRPIAERSYTRTDLGLPQSGFIFCCFNNSFKILPSTFDRWMNILRSVPHSVLWLLATNEETEKNLRHEAERRDVAPERLFCAQRMPLSEHLARQRVADLFMDTWPYNAHTTASDALWAGLPVLTCMGQSFASRVAASLLRAIELPELVTHSPVEFESRAIELATHPEQLEGLRRRLQQNRLTTALFDTERFTRDFERILEDIHRRP